MKRLIKGNKVRIISGKDRTKEGLITSISYKTNTAIVEGMNMVKRNQKPTQQNQNKGGIISKEMPIHLCKLALINSKSKKGITKIGYKMEGNKKVRITHGDKGVIIK
ncbi:50S ribosomal protein L24 [Bacilli bacterium]|nr:50S ribosomal protein L24 [Bacilli bacterium]